MYAQITESEVDDRELPDSETCWALLERVVASTQLRRASRLREFLLFVGRRSLKEGCDQIHEQEIGAEVFGRAGAYDTSIDNIVRVNASELRKRIEAYFESEGLSETLILEIPRGSYKPVFRYRAVQHVTVAKPEPEAATEPLPNAEVLPAPSLEHATPAGKSAVERRLLAIVAVLAVILGAVSATLWLQNRAMHRSLYAWQRNPSVASLWSQILDARPSTDIILADTSFALIEDITRKTIPLSDYLSRKYVNDLSSQELSLDRRDDLGLIAARNFGSLGDFHVARRIVALDPLATHMHLYYARDYMPALIKQDNVILIGSRKSNPWVDLFEPSMNFTVDYDPNRFVSFVRNRAPSQGEQAVYMAPSAPEASSGYSVVAYLPNPDQDGKVLIIAGTGSEATEAAGEFLTSDEQLSRFQAMLHVDKLPYFEALLKTTHISGTPLNAKIEAYRVYPAPR